jgi:Spy/CpxP family protein refolding chaperone
VNQRCVVDRSSSCAAPIFHVPQRLSMASCRVPPASSRLARSAGGPPAVKRAARPPPDGAVRDMPVQLVIWVKRNRLSNCLIGHRRQHTMKATTKWVAMAAALTLSATLAVAAPHGGGKGGRGGARGEFSERFAQKLNLTDTQKQQVRETQQSFREQNKAFFEQMKDTHRQMREAKQSGDAARIDALKATVQSQRERMKQLRQEQTERIVALLTPEQRAQFDALKAERKANRGFKQRGRRQ